MHARVFLHDTRARAREHTETIFVKKKRISNNVSHENAYSVRQHMCAECNRTLEPERACPNDARWFRMCVRV